MSAKTFSVGLSVTIKNKEYFNSAFMAAIDFYKNTLLKNFNNICVDNDQTIRVKDEYSGNSETFTVEQIKDFLKDSENYR